jgi:hypothetical protein
MKLPSRVKQGVKGKSRKNTLPIILHRIDTLLDLLDMDLDLVDVPITIEVEDTLIHTINQLYPDPMMNPNPVPSEEHIHLRFPRHPLTLLQILPRGMEKGQMEVQRPTPVQDLKPGGDIRHIIERGVITVMEIRPCILLVGHLLLRIHHMDMHTPDMRRLEQGVLLLIITGKADTLVILLLVDMKSIPGMDMELDMKSIP